MINRSKVLLAAIAIILLAASAALQPFVPATDTVYANASNHTVSIHTNSAVLDDFLGVGVNLIPASFMEGTAQYGYNEAHWEMDRKRIVAMNPKVARVWFQTDWMEQTKGSYNWNSSQMQAFYKYMDVLKEAGTEVEFNFGWKVGANIQSWFSIPGVDPRISAPLDLDAFANAASAALNELINNRGYDNIKYLTFYNEPNGFWDFEAPGDQKAYYANMVKKVVDRLTMDGLRQLVEIWGPEESGDPSWSQYMYNNADDYFDAYTFHVYGQPYDGLSASIASRKNVVGGKPVILTEFGFAEDKSEWEAGLAGSVIKAANEGLKGALIWQLNGVWLPDPYVGSDTNGNYTLWDSIALGTEPYRRYYESSLLTRYIPAHSTVLSVQTDSPDVRAAAFKTDAGDYSIVVETKEGVSRNIAFNFNGANIGKTFYKYVYQSSVVPEGNALIPAASGTFSVGTSFVDGSVDAARNVIVYTTLPPQTQVAVAPLEPVVGGGQQIQLGATVIDNTGGVAWSVIGSGNGTVSPGGVYTAPHVAAEKLVAVKATSVQKPDSYGIALVKVRPASTSGRVDIPTMSLKYGKYASAEAVTITTTTPGAIIRYTTNGATPTASSTLYTGPIIMNAGTHRLKAVAFKAGMTASAEAYNLYKIADASSGPDNYQFCAYENGFDCNFSGTASVAFGAEGLFEYKTLTNGTACTAEVFGDPIPGAVKRCYYSYHIPDSPPVVTIYNSGFEKPGTTAYISGPMTNGWSFNQRAGVQANGSAFGATPAPGGTQTAYLQSVNGAHGIISQTINFRAGTYSLGFQAAKRMSYGGTQSFNVFFDDVLIGTYAPLSGSFAEYTTDSFVASAGYHTIKFVGTSTTGDNTAFIDNVSIDLIQPQPPVTALLNPGFETPVTSNYLKGPMTNGWSFNARAGVRKNGSALGGDAAPEGVQTAFLQSVNGNHGEISQSIVFEAGVYTLNFQAAKRTSYGGTQSFDVFFDDVLIGSYAPESGSFASFTTSSFAATAGSHTIKFVGTSVSGDNTAFIDAVELQWIAPPNPVVNVANSGFETPVTTNYLKGPMTNGWSFNARAGVRKNGSALGGDAAPEGVQTAFLQSVNGNHGEISQTFVFEAGVYTLSFQSAKRTSYGGTQSFDVFVDDVLIGSYAPESGSFASFTTSSFAATAGSHTIKFVGTSVSGDNTAFIDAVAIQ